MGSHLLILYTRENAMNIYIKKGVSVLYNRKNGDIHFSISTSGVHKIYNITDEYHVFLELIQIEHDVDDIYYKIKKKYPEFKKQEFLETIEELRKEGILTYDVSHTESFSTQEINRYKRQVDFFGDLNPVVINSWDFQKKLKESVVLILGIGGLGSWIAQLLTMMGIGKLIICDFDYVEEHNLTRQTLYDINDIGTKKIDSLSRKLLLINDNLVVEKINKKIENKTDLLDLKKQICLSDVIINCADFPDINTTSTWVSELCMKFDKKHIIGGGYNGHTGLIGPSIIPYKSACWKCFDEKYKKEVENSDLEVVINTRKSAGAISVLSNIIASIQAWECVKLITDVDEIKTLNRRGFFNINTFEIEWEEIDEVDKCSTCRGKCK